MLKHNFKSGIITCSFPSNFCSSSHGEHCPACGCITTPTTDLTMTAIPNTGHGQAFSELDVVQGVVFLATFQTIYAFVSETYIGRSLTPPDTQSPVRRPKSLSQSSTKPPVWRLRRRCLSFNFCFLSVDGMTCIVNRFVANETIYRMERITAQSVSYFRL
jgi:hypothetical protein